MKIKYILAFIAAGLLAACSNNISNKLENNKQISIFAGESVVINWKFENADSVLVSNIDSIFAAEDSINVTPLESTTYFVNALNYYGDKQTMKWQINVISQPKTGPELSDLISFEKSVELSNYLAGVTKENNISQIKIIGNTFPYNSNNFSLKFLPLDKFGNYIENLEILPENLELEAKNSKIKPNIISYNEKINLNPELPLNICFCIDNSAAAEENHKIFQQISAFSQKFPAKDNYFISYFNHNFGQLNLIQKNFSDNSFEDFYSNIPSPGGFAAINKYVGQTINLLNENSGQNVIILITQSADNASILYDERDLLLHARNNNVPIYVIAIGSGVPTFNFNYLANGSGGALYLLDSESLAGLPNVLNEITFSQKFHYSIDFSAAVGTSQNELNLELLLRDTSYNVLAQATYNIPLKQDKVYSEFQALAAFENDDEIVPETYFSELKSLAAALNDNPTLLVELTGNSNSYEGNEKECKQKGLARSQNVRRKLIEFGANPAQLRVNSEGSALPIYPFPQNNWQKHYNSRVEIHWLLPETLPFEIIAGSVKTEFEAQNEVEKFENNGFRAYYQRIIAENRPAYRIIIWGYATEELALEAQQKLKKNFKNNFEIR